YGSSCSSCVFQICIDFLRLSGLRQTTRMPECVVCEPRKNLRPALESFPRRSLADGYIRVVRLLCFSMSRIHHAHRKPHADQRINQRDLFVGERKLFVESPDDGRSRLEHVLLSENRIRNPGRQFRDCNPMMRIAEINYAGDVRLLSPSALYE